MIEIGSSASKQTVWAALGTQVLLLTLPLQAWALRLQKRKSSCGHVHWGCRWGLGSGIQMLFCSSIIHLLPETLPPAPLSHYRSSCLSAFRCNGDSHASICLCSWSNGPKNGNDPSDAVAPLCSSSPGLPDCKQKHETLWAIWMAHKQHIIFVRALRVIMWVCAMRVREFWGLLEGYIKCPS